jgi:hypothetical protein
MTISTVPVELEELRTLVRAVRQGAEANERPDLVRRLTAAAEVVAAPSVAGADAVATATTVMRSLQSLEIDLRTRRAALRDPGRGARLAAESRHAEARLRRFTERAAEWPRVLGEALSAAGSDVDLDVQSRLRALVDEGTAMIGSHRKGGDGVDGWLDEHLVSEVETCYGALRSAADAVAGRIATSLELAVAVPPVELALVPPEDVVADLRRGPRGGSERQPLSGRLLGVVMPTYSGMMVSLVLPRILGLRLPVWLIVVAGVLGAAALGGVAVSGERQRQISRRRAEAAAELRSTVDAFRMALARQLRDGVRLIEQQLDVSLGEATARHGGRLSAAAAASRRAAESTGRTDDAVTEIESDLASVRELQLRALRIVQGPAAEPSGGAGQRA